MFFLLILYRWYFLLLSVVREKKNLKKASRKLTYINTAVRSKVMDLKRFTLEVQFLMFIHCPCYTGVCALPCGSLGDFGVLGALYNRICNVRNWMCLVPHYHQGLTTEGKVAVCSAFVMPSSMKSKVLTRNGVWHKGWSLNWQL